MPGLCKSGNEPAGSLKQISYIWLIIVIIIIIIIIIIICGLEGCKGSWEALKDKLNVHNFVL